MPSPTSRDPSPRGEAMREILLLWGDLSLGDVSVLCACWRGGGAVGTLAGSSHAEVWRQLCVLGWAELLYSPIDCEEIGIDMRTYRLTDAGDTELPRFLIWYDLLNMGPCTPHRAAGAVEAAPPTTHGVVRAFGTTLGAGVAFSALLIGLKDHALAAVVMFGWSVLIGLFGEYAGRSPARSKALAGVLMLNALLAFGIAGHFVAA